jgi:hypothetical protein
MLSNGNSTVRAAQRLRRIARLIGSLAAVFWVFSLTASFIGEVISDSFFHAEINITLAEGVHS